MEFCGILRRVRLRYSKETWRKPVNGLLQQLRSYQVARTWSNYCDLFGM